MAYSSGDDDDGFSPPAKPRLILDILDVIHQHFDGDLVITPGFLFSVCSILARNCEYSQPELLVAVLRCLRRTWRTQPPHTRSLSALSRNLAALATPSIVSQTGLAGGNALSPVRNSSSFQAEHTPEKPTRTPQTPTASKKKVGTPSFRSGCTACKHKRNSALEPLKLVVPLQDLRTPTPRPIAPHLVRRVGRKDENEPLVSTPSKARRIYPQAAPSSNSPSSPGLLSPQSSSRRTASHTPNRNVFRVKNS